MKKSGKMRKVTFDTSWGRVSFNAPVTKTNRKSLYKALKPLFRNQDVRLGTDIEWHYDAEEPNACCADGCHEEMNGVYYAKVKIGRAEFWINACAKCKKKAGEMI